MAYNPLIPSIGAGISQSYSSGGSINNAQSSGWAQSGTNAMDARAWSEAQSALAWNRDLEAMKMQMAFNSAEAQKQRDWQEQMANTIYTRSVANMKEAGINPILAANMGLSGAGVSSGATASIGGAPSAPLAQNFMDSWSASQNASQSHGSSYNQSEGGIVTALTALGSALAKGLSAVNSGMNLTLNMSSLQREINDISENGLIHDDSKPGTDQNAAGFHYNTGPDSHYDVNNSLWNFAGELGKLVRDKITGLFQ